MDQNQRSNRNYQFHPSRNVVLDLFNLYLGRSSKQKSDDTGRETPNKMQKRVIALNTQLPPPNEHFLFDFEQLYVQFPDKEQLRAITESVLITLVLQCSSHAPQAEFLLFVLRSWNGITHVNWDTFLPSLLSSISSTESSLLQGNQALIASSSTGLVTNSSNFQVSIPASPLSSVHVMGSPPQTGGDSSSCVPLSPAKTTNTSCSGESNMLKHNLFPRYSTISYVRQLSCKIILIGLESNLKPITHFEIFSHMMNWLVNWDLRQGVDDSDSIRAWKCDTYLSEWLHSCLDVIWILVDENKYRIPFYELIRSGLQFTESIPDDEALFTIVLEIHRRRDMVAMHMQMLDQHLHCPTFGNNRFPFQIHPNNSIELMANMRYSPITYPSVLGEPLHGEDLANSIKKGSLDWERALRCLRHAIYNTPSPEWWKRVLVIAPCYRSQAPMPGAVFSPEMICEAFIDRIMELLRSTTADTQCWQEWLIFGDVFFFMIKSGCIDFIDFVNKLVSRVAKGDPQILWSNHVTWLFAQVIRNESVISALSDPNKVETIRKILSFHKDPRTSDTNAISPVSILLDFISSSQTLRIWGINSLVREDLNHEQLQKGKQIDEWWKQATKGERVIDLLNMDERSVGMFWVLSYTMAQPACDAMIGWLTSAGVTEFVQGPNVQSGERVMMMRESLPLSMSFLSGLSINLCQKLVYQLEETLFLGTVIPSISLVETYVRLLLLAPHSLFRSHFNALSQRTPSLLSKFGATLLLMEILNYRLLPWYRYHGKAKALVYDVSKIISMLKGKGGEHRTFRLAENLCMNLILSLREFFLVKKELKGPTDFTETLNRVAIVSLAITIKTRGIAEAEHMSYIQPLLEQILSMSQHTWSEKTLRHFPTLIRDYLKGRPDKRAQVIQAWKQSETTVTKQCNQLLSPSSADAGYIMTYISNSFPEHKQYLCAGAWRLMNARPESINCANLARVLKEFSPEEVTSNIYTLVDVLLHHIQLDVQRGHSIQDLLLKASANLCLFVWTHEIFPLDILLLALIDRDDDSHALHILISLLDRQELQQRIKAFASSRGSPEFWLNSGSCKRVDLQKALGNHLSWKERYPPFFDDIAARLIPVIPLIIYRLIENDITDVAERVLAIYTPLLAYHPLRFTFVRDILAYFYGNLPNKLIRRILQVLDLSKIPFSESFPQQIGSSTSAVSPSSEYYLTLLLGLVNHVIPPLNSRSKFVVNKTQVSSQSDGQKSFYQIQDPGTYTQLILETSVIEILSLPVSASQIVSSFVQMVVHIQSTLILMSNGQQQTSSALSQSLPTSPTGVGTDSSSGLSASNFISRSGYTCQQLSSLLIQACGLLLSQLPQEFHMQLYSEAARIIKDCWWLTDGKRSSRELDSAVGYALLDPTWASQDNTSTAIGNVVALLHSFFVNLPHEWLESTHTIIKHLRPLTSVAMLRIVFRILGPLLPRFSFSHGLFIKTIALLLAAMADVFGRNSHSSNPPDVAEIMDLIDFLYHAVLYEGQGGPVQTSSKPKLETLAYFGKVMENLRPDVQHFLSHLKTDSSSSIYAATHPKLSPNSG